MSDPIQEYRACVDLDFATGKATTTVFRVERYYPRWLMLFFVVTFVIGVLFGYKRGRR